MRKELKKIKERMEKTNQKGEYMDLLQEEDIFKEIERGYKD